MKEKEKKIILHEHRRLKTVKKEAPSIRGAKDKNRVGLCLCIQCDKSIHSVAHRLGVSTLQEFQYQDVSDHSVVVAKSAIHVTIRNDLILHFSLQMDLSKL